MTFGICYEIAEIFHPSSKHTHTHTLRDKINATFPKRQYNRKMLWHVKCHIQRLLPNRNLFGIKYFQDTISIIDADFNGFFSLIISRLIIFLGKLRLNLLHFELLTIIKIQVKKFFPRNRLLWFSVA